MSKYQSLDKFEVADMNAVDFKKRQDYILKNCKCLKCPTYVKGDPQAGFCFPTYGTSKVINKEKDCICKTCSIYNEYELNHSYYCTRCSQYCQGIKTDMAGGQGGSG